MTSTRRRNPYTDSAVSAVERMQRVLDNVIAKYSIPLGQEIVPASTRRARQVRTADELAGVLLDLAVKYGLDQVQEVLGLPDDQTGTTMLESIVQQYGQETVQRAFQLLTLRYQRQMQPAPADQYLPAATAAA